MTLVTQKLKLELDPGKFFPYEYGYRSELHVIFSALKKGHPQKVTENEFRSLKKGREIFIGTRGQSPLLALQLLMKAYPDATILMRVEPEKV